MKAIVENQWHRGELAVFLYEPLSMNEAIAYRVEDGHLVGERQEVGPKPEVTLYLRPDAAEALLAALGNVLPPSDATVEHLKDARDTRDRLLSMLEKRGVR